MDNDRGMSPSNEPIEPDDVIDSTERSASEKVRSAAARAYATANSGARSIRQAASGSRLIEQAETTLNSTLGKVSAAIDDAVRSGKVDRAFDKAQQTVTSGAKGVRKIVDRTKK